MESVNITTGIHEGDYHPEEFCEVFGRSVLQIDLAPIGARQLKVDMTLRSLPGIGIGYGFSTPMRSAHLTSLADSDDLVLVFLNDGHATFEKNGESTPVAPGDVVFTSIGEVAAFTLPTNGRFLNLRLNRSRLAPKLLDLRASFRTPTLQESAALRLLKSYTDAITGGDLVTPGLQNIVSTHLYDLAAVALGATRDASAAAAGRGIRAARLQVIKTDILDHLTDENLNIGAIARRYAISESYIRQLFADEATTFTDFVLQQRLALAHRCLSGTASDERSISRIAFDCGFSDLSYFNRCFRRRYHATPSDIRSQARNSS